MRAVLPIVLVFSCGDPDAPEPVEGSGVPRETLLVELTGPDMTTMCEYTVGLGPIAGDCTNGEYVMIGKLNVPDCIAQNVQRQDIFKMCTATVGDVEDCTRAFLPFTPQQLCSDFVLPEVCVNLFSNACGGL